MSIELKLKTLTAREIADVVTGRLELYNTDGEAVQKYISTSSKETGTGIIFCAIRGERVDAADFIPEALEWGTDCVICQRIPEEAKESGKPFAAVIVEDTITAMGELASYYREFTEAKFIGITGSVGKTTTKEYIAAVTSTVYKTHKTEGNYNNLLGLPLTIFGIEPDDKVAVLEMGMSDLGEIEYLSKIARPDIAVVTNIGTSHLASLGTRENICRAKMEIRYGMPKDGVLILNGDEPLLVDQYNMMEDKPRLMSVSNPQADYRAVNIRSKADGMVYDLLYDSRAITNVEIPSLGKHNVYNSLAAYAVGTILDIPDEAIRRGLRSFRGVDRRQKVYDVGGITVIDDCYNASPESMRAAIDVLVSMAEKTHSRPTALLGDMLELGEYSRLMHDQLGQYAAQAEVQKLYCYGAMADIVAEAAIKKGVRAENVYVSVDIRDAQTMADMILKTLEPGDILLVKASRGVRAERVIECMQKRLSKKKHN